MIEMTRTEGHALGPSTVRLGDLEVQRLGYGAMRLPGRDVWGEPDDPARARKVVRRAVELGMNFIDTAWYYGPLVANRLIAEALHPYPRDLVIATKLGGKRLPNKGWAPALRPEELRQGAEEDLRTLRLERLDVVHLRHMPAAGIPLMESLDVVRRSCYRSPAPAPSSTSKKTGTLAASRSRRPRSPELPGGLEPPVPS